MVKILKIIGKFLFKKITLNIGVILLAINITILGCIGYTQINMTITLKYIERYLDIQVLGQQQQIENIYGFLKTMIENTIITDKNELDLISKILENINNLENTQKNIANKLEEIKTIDLDNIENIKQANLVIYNETAGIMGAGTHLRYGNKDYILTCAHLIENSDDLFIAVENENNEEILLELVNYNEIDDLALFRMKKIAKHIPFLEISNEFPKVGSEVIVIGNPDWFEDVVSDGIISKIEDKIYLMTNKVYCGNSGGAVIYKGKIVGVLSAMQIMFNFPQIQNYAIAINLDIIQTFLRECNLEQE